MPIIVLVIVESKVSKECRDHWTRPLTDLRRIIISPLNNQVLHTYIIPLNISEENRSSKCSGHL